MVETVYSYNTNTTQLPPWMQTSIQDIINRATPLLNEPYQPYGGPRVAGLTQDQISAGNIVRDNVGAYNEYTDEARDWANRAALVNTGAAGRPSFDQATGMFSKYGSMDTAGLATPYLGEGSGLIRQSAQGNSLSAANPYIAASVSPQGLSAASPYMQMAGTSFPQMAQAYMNPYNEAVTGEIARLGARNLSENLLPQISDQFIRAGQFGSPQQRDIVGRALRDTQEGILSQQTQALQQGYNTAGQLYGQDAARYAGLAGTAGGLGTAQQQALLGAGSALGNLSAADLNRLQQAGVNLGQFGLSQAGLAGADAARGIQAAQGISGIGQAQIAAAEADAARGMQASQQIGNLGVSRNNMMIQNAAALGAIGAEQQGQTQRNLDVAYGDFQNQQQYPWQQLGSISNLVHGLPSSTSMTSSSQTSQPSPSMVSQVGGLALGGLGLANSGLFRAKGGAVRKYSRGGRVRNTPRGIGGYSMAA